MPDVYVITGAGSGFGALAARALAKAGQTVYAGMYSHTGDFSHYQKAAEEFAKAEKVDLRTVPLNLFDQESCMKAVAFILKDAGKLDAVIHNAGHMNYGPGEAFTADQYLSLYDSNVVGTQRLNLAVLPYFRSQKKGHLIWISSTSVYGAKGTR
jgi:NADP-dependent 3-hydroxy acid dehydrogenase YdfG